MSLLMYLNQRMASYVTPDHSHTKYTGLMPAMSTYVSRCNYKPDLFKYKLVCRPIDEIRTYNNHNKSWDYIMDERAIELSKLDGTIYVMYSGGVDSTGIIVSIMKNWSVEDLKRVVILCTPSSVYEFPELFNILITQFRIEYLKPELSSYTKNGYLISGMLGEIFFPEPDMANRVLQLDNNILNINYKVYGEKLFSIYNPKFGKEIFDRLEPISSESIYPIDNLLDFVSWTYYTQLWQKILFSHMINKGCFDDINDRHKYIHFYDHVDFEIWGIYNKELAHLHNNGVFKVIPKRYICDYLKIESYMYKKKVPSYYYPLLGTENNYGLDENYKFLSKEESLKFII